MKSKYLVLIVFLLISCAASYDLMAERLRGKIRNIARDAKTVEILDFSTGKYGVFQFTQDTIFLNAKTIDDLHENENVEILFKADNLLQSIKKMVVYVQEDQIITTAELQALIDNPNASYLMFDTRSRDEYKAGHLPSAVWAPAVNTAPFKQMLPIEKDKRIIFYSDDVTSESAPKAARQVVLDGYQNVKVYLFGISAWRLNKKPIVVNGSWLIENLSPQTVLVDTRTREKSLKSHIKNAVAIPGIQVLQTFIKNPSINTLSALPNKNARIVLYGDTTYDDCILDVYRELLKREYKNITVLDGGLYSWTLNYQIEQSPAPAGINSQGQPAE
jgi:rhodanese-related sulfurtransferase